MIFGTWNVQGLTNKIPDIITAQKKSNVNLMVLTETKKKGNGREIMDEYIHIWSGVNKAERAKAGVSILIRKTVEKFIKNYTFVSERIITMTISAYGYKTTVIGVYGPNDDSDQETKDKFWRDLENTLDETKRHQEVVIIGDLNARVGSRQNDAVVGRFGEVVVNNSGQRLIELCNQYNLRILNTFLTIKPYTVTRGNVRHFNKNQ